MAKANPFLKKPVQAGKDKPARLERKKGLGRGLDSLLVPSGAGAAPAPAATFANEAKAQPAQPASFELSIAEIERSPYQPRRDFNDEELKGLADSIKNGGLVQPPVVRRNSAGRWELISGERRVRAAQLLGWRTIQVVVKNVGDLAAATMTASENLNREDLNPIEEAESYRVLQEKFGLSQQEVADRVGRGRATVANATRLLELPDEVRELVAKGLLSAGHAKVILSVEDEKSRIILARDCVSSRLSVRALEKRALKKSGGVEPARQRGRPTLPDSYVKGLSDAMRRHLGCAVRITSGLVLPNGKRTKGIVEIDFFDNDDLDRILKMIGVEVE